MSKVQEPCMCGDPECKLCFPFDLFDEQDPDEAYDALRQEAVDNGEPWPPEG